MTRADRGCPDAAGVMTVSSEGSMLTQGESVEAHALRGRGWTVSAIARHLGRERKTIRSSLAGETVPGRLAASGHACVNSRNDTV